MVNTPLILHLSIFTHKIPSVYSNSPRWSFEDDMFPVRRPRLWSLNKTDFLPTSSCPHGSSDSQQCGSRIWNSCTTLYNSKIMTLTGPHAFHLPPATGVKKLMGKQRPGKCWGWQVTSFFLVFSQSSKTFPENVSEPLQS